MTEVARSTHPPATGDSVGPYADVALLVAALGGGPGDAGTSGDRADVSSARVKHVDASDDE